MLTKSELQSHLQCARKLWLERHKPELVAKDDPGTYRRAVDGNIVAEKAREQLGAGFIWPPSKDGKKEAAVAAKDLLRQSPGVAAAEVPMVFGELYARADALIPGGDQYALRETKASNFPLKNDKITPGMPKQHHLEDLAIQAWVMTGSGLSIGRVELNLLNGRWRYPGGGDYAGLFRQLDVTGEINVLKNKVPGWLDDAKQTLNGEMPKTQTGKHCSDPYECPFQDHCKKLDPAGPEHPIELLPDNAGKQLAKKLRDTKGYSSVLEPQPEELIGAQSGLYRRIQESHRTGRAILDVSVAEIVKAFPYPRYYFDFEGIDFPVPRWAGVRPYEHVTFQWSCHVERTPDVFEHYEFLDLSGNDPSLPCIQRIREVIDQNDGGPIFVYYAPYEKARLQGLADRHPAYELLLAGYVNRLVDLLPLIKGNYYHPRMQGSFSIKKVIPTIAPDLSYDELGEIQDGTAAQVAYLHAVFDAEAAPQRKSELEDNLRKYCRQDTWAMVEVAYFLSQAGRPRRPEGM